MSEPTGFKRALGRWDVALLVAGSMIGTGIFLSAGGVARKLPGPGWVLLVWTLGGLHALAGGFTFAELGAIRPAAGGPFVWLSETMGPLPAFLYNWAFFFVVEPAGVAALAVGLSQYAAPFLPIGGAENSFAIAALLALTTLNACGIELGSRVNGVLTALKALALGAFAVLGAQVAGGRLPLSPGGVPSLVAIGGAFAGVLWAYDGWPNVAALAGEVRRPEKDLPFGLAAGVFLVLVLYVFTNAAYLVTLPSLGAAARPAEETARMLFGAPGARAVAAAIFVAILGSLAANIPPGPRVAWAAAHEGWLPSAFARLHPRFATPAFGLLVQAAWSAVLVLSGTFDHLVEMIAFAGTAFYALAGATLFLYRRKGVTGAFRCPGYPWLPGSYLTLSALFSLGILFDAPTQALAGLGILAVGAVLYFARARSRARSASSHG